MTTQANSSTTTNASTEGTNNRSKRSVKRWVGDFWVSASLTILTTLASVVSAARRVTAISIAPGPLIVPAKTRFCAGTLSGWAAACARDRQSVVSGKSVSVRVDLGGRPIIKKTTIATKT